MIAFDLTIAAGQVLASSGSSGEGEAFKLIFLLSGPAYFFFMYTRYRNQNKRHHHESETQAETANMTGDDQKVNRVTGVSSPQISGANQDQVSGARN